LEPHDEKKMFKNFTANNNNKYIDVLDDFVERYNNTRHSSIKTPVEAIKKENVVRVYKFCKHVGSKPHGMVISFKSQTQKAHFHS